MAKTTKINSAAMKPPRRQASLDATVGPWQATYAAPGGAHSKHA